MTFDLLKIYQSDGVTWPGQQKDKDNDKEKHLLTYTVGDSWQSLFLWLEEKNEENIARIANAVQVTICLLLSTSVY